MMQKAKFVVLLLLMAVIGRCACYAQDPPGIAELYQVSGTMHSYYGGFSDLVLVLGALSGLLGGLRVYVNWQGGRHHIDRQVMGWFFSCLFLLLTGTFLRGLFGL